MSCKSEIPNNQNCENCKLKNFLRSREAWPVYVALLGLNTEIKPGDAFSGRTPRKIVKCNRELEIPVFN